VHKVREKTKRLSKLCVCVRLSFPLCEPFHILFLLRIDFSGEHEREGKIAFTIYGLALLTFATIT